MKKNLFYLIGTWVLILLSVTNIRAQVPDQPKFNYVTPLPSALGKSPSKVSKDLNSLYKDYLAGINSIIPKQKPVSPLIATGIQKSIQTKGGKVLVDITLKESSNSNKAELEKAGFKILGSYGRIVSGILPVEAISRLETISNIKFVRPAYKPRHAFKTTGDLLKWCAQDSGTITPVISQGDTAQRSYIAREKYKVNGKGVTVGLLSDSYDNLGTASIGVANGELPGNDNPFGFKTPVKVLEDEDDFGGADEGRAMAEIVHDVAPGAAIDFATANGGQGNFAQNILNLADSGCKVIADDVYYYAEPFFQDGIIAQVIDDVKKQGVTYFSAAGNESRQSYESNFRGSNVYPLGAVSGTAHNFSAPGNAPIYYQPITIPAFGYTIFNLQWDDPFYSQGGSGATSDLDMYLLDSQGKIVSFGNEDNIASGDPIELFDFFNTTPGTLFYIVITKFSGPDPLHLKYIYYGDGTLYSVTPGIRAGTLVGHAKAEGAIATAASFFYETPAYASDTPRVETFSSLGGVYNYLDVNGERTTPVRRQKPEITAPDGGNTSFFPPYIYYGNQDIPEDADSYPNFFGTSAAAPHAAGVAALMIEAQKLNTITPDQIKSALTRSAIDMNNIYSLGFEKGFDFNTGYGLIQADKAVGTVKYPNIYIKDLKVEAICSDSPAVTRNWKIINHNTFGVEVHWILSGYGQQGTIVAPHGETTFSTNTAYYMNLPVPNIVIIDWKDNLDSTRIDIAYSTSAKCGQDSVAARNSDQRLSTAGNTGISERAITAEVYPNPSTKNFRLYLSATGLQNVDIALYSIDGKLLYQKAAPANGVVDIEASKYKPGLYILKVKQGEFNRTFKLIKQ